MSIADNFDFWIYTLTTSNASAVVFSPNPRCTPTSIPSRPPIHTPVDITWAGRLHVSVRCPRDSEFNNDATGLPSSTVVDPLLCGSERESFSAGRTPWLSRSAASSSQRFKQPLAPNASTLVAYLHIKLGFQHHNTDIPVKLPFHHVFRSSSHLSARSA